jgi:hypothetical protein
MPRSPQVQVLTGLGAVETASLDATMQECTVELGRENIVHLRWPTGRPATPTTKATVQEAYFWD